MKYKILKALDDLVHHFRLADTKIGNKICDMYDYELTGVKDE